MNVTQAIELIRTLFEQSCTELFESMHCNVEPAACNDVESAYIPAAYIDAGADDFELLLTLRLPLAALTMTYPIQDQIVSIDESELEDWILELSNRLLGLLKAKLMSRDCRLNTGLPSHDFGEDTTQSINQCEYIPYYYKLDEEPIEMGITLETFSETIAIEDDAKEDDSAQAGDLDFFF
ncbi:hypothetical protein [Marinagarivorans cellulosilyticus]|uniref:Chemotaxis phosphatase CheX-like domain-containing protein n=1 Tax=Marinagarivorans cellulosilyticus TaxID=2721545 RepID=A0AAN1WJG6_9GAMM|nr:hypothetical protein [Marinagarivorans cellulosilyticus]BCD98728.1 hypothetical protein MARGE09_P2929 [Marinagarivorans cellulosilyticus]